MIDTLLDRQREEALKTDWVAEGGREHANRNISDYERWTKGWLCQYHMLA